MPRKSKVYADDLLAPFSKYPLLSECAKTEAAVSDAAISECVSNWKRNGVVFPDWIAPYVLQPATQICLRHNHIRGYGCGKIGCGYVHACLFCHCIDHGVFGIRMQCSRFVRFEEQVAKYNRERSPSDPDYNVIVKRLRDRHLI